MECELHSVPRWHVFECFRLVPVLVLPAWHVQQQPRSDGVLVVPGQHVRSGGQRQLLGLSNGCILTSGERLGRRLPLRSGHIRAERELLGVRRRPLLKCDGRYRLLKLCSWHVSKRVRIDLVHSVPWTTACQFSRGELCSLGLRLQRRLRGTG